MTTTLSSSTVSQRTCRERSTSRPGRPRAISPVNAYSDLSFASDISAASSSAADSVSSWTQSGSSRSSSPPTDPDEAAEEDSTGKSSALREGVEVAQHLTERESEAIAAIRSRPSPSAADQTAPPFLFLPPLLSRLPISAAPSSSRDRDDVGPALFDSARAASSQSGYAAELDGADSAPVAYTTSHLPTIDPASQALHHALHAFRPVTPRYATSPYADSFNWPDLRLEDDSTGRVKRGAREWYIVAFRSRRNAGLPEDRARELYEADRAAHEEAVTRGGLILYWYGNPVPAPSASSPHDFDIDDVGRNLATCIWQSRADAITAMRGEHHKEAARLASTTYEYYTLERYILRKEPGELTVRILPWHGKEVEGAVSGAGTR